MTAAAAGRLPLLGAMARDLDRHGTLKPATATAMWAGYAAHTLLAARALRRPGARLRLPAGPARVTGTVVAAAGLGICLTGMRRFAGPSELTGTSNRALITTGIYRYSRNPQYVGYVTALGGAALGRRSTTALSWTGVLAAVYAAWVPVEEGHLRDLFGQAYIDYLNQTNRWWGRSR
jgi:protein-S-isoprenylcysteine O-methyltransferase Ste14